MKKLVDYSDSSDDEDVDAKPSPKAQEPEKKPIMERPKVNLTARPIVKAPEPSLPSVNNQQYYNHPQYQMNMNSYASTSTSNPKRKRQRNELPEDAQIIEVSQRQQLHMTPEQQVYADELKQKELKRQQELFEIQQQLGTNTDNQKRKHNIQWLMNEARVRKTELEEKHAASRAKMVQSRRKYGL